MNISTETNTVVDKNPLTKNHVADAVYREQVSLLYRQLPIAMLSALLAVPVFAYVVWTPENSAVLILWLSMVALLNVTRFLSVRKFNSTADFNVHRWEHYYLVSTVLSALLWGSTSFWLNIDSPASQHVLQIIIIIGLTGGAVATLTPRISAFRLFLVLILVPYVARFIYLGTPVYLANTFLICVYIVLMLPVSKRVHSVITESLRLRFENIELLELYKKADENNKKANVSLYEVMQKNKQEELALKKSESFLRSILVTANDSIITTDRKGIILTANHAIQRDFGYTEAEMIGKSINMIMGQDLGDKHDRYMEQYFQSDRPSLVGRMLDVVGKRKDGSLFPMEITVSESIIDDEIYFTGIIRDITERKQTESAMESMMIELAHAKRDLEKVNSQLSHQNKELTELSEHDALTGLPNRRYLRNAFAQEWPRHQRNRRPIAIVLLDIDFFKKYNDQYGHQAGDACLKNIAQVFINNISRPADFIARYGGEEFIAVLPETDLEGAYHIAENMRLAIAKLEITHKDSTIAGHVTISGGVASLIPAAENDSDTLIKQADEALYAAKNSGRNRICLFNRSAPVIDKI